MPFVEYLVKQSTVLDWLQLGLAQCVSVPKTYDPFELSLYFWLSSDQIMHIHVVRIILVLNVIILFLGGGGVWLSMIIIIMNLEQRKKDQTKDKTERQHIHPAP